MARILLLIICLELAFPGVPRAEEQILKKECVIVLHGMGRTKYAMRKVEKDLAGAGYTVWNRSYPSTQKPIEVLAVEHISKGLEFCRRVQAEKVHFVTHSLGGILVRHYLQDNTIDNLDKIIMLSPPNQGSEVADGLKDLKLYQWMMGPAGQQLGTGADSLPNTLDRIDATVGIITGNSTSDPWFSPFIPGEDDGKVSVKSARLEEMTDFLVVEAGHTFIMSNRSVLKQIRYFLEKGNFKR
jgi:triacylglycerol lipase